MKISYQFKDIEASGTLHKTIEEGIESMNCFPHVPIMSAHVVVGRQRKLYFCEVIVSTPFHTFKASFESKLIENTVEGCLDRVFKQMEKHNSKLKKHNKDHHSDMRRSA